MPAKKRKYYLAETYEDNLHTASIVRNDNEKILQQQGYIALQFHHIKDGSAVIKIRRLGEIAKLSLLVKKGDTVVFHFPLLANAYKILLGLLNRKGVQSIALIIDIDGLRYHNQELLKKELASLQSFTHIIAHNASMKHFLTQYISRDKISCIELFDFPAAENIKYKSLSHTICFAGNFEKAAFVNELYKSAGTHFNLYGPSFTADDQKNVSYKGSFPSNELPGILEGSFGLVWDGSSIDQCDDYLQYNNPYKMSLYIAAGLPLIVWEKSAAASFVTQHKIGILIKSLHEIESWISKLAELDYEEIKENVLSLRVKITKGHFLKNALEKLPGNTAV